EPSANRAVTVTGQGLSASPALDSRLPNTPLDVAMSAAWTLTVTAPPSALGAFAQPSTQATWPKCSVGDASVIVGQSMRARVPEPITVTLDSAAPSPLVGRIAIAAHARSLARSASTICVCPAVEATSLGATS